MIILFAFISFLTHQLVNSFSPSFKCSFDSTIDCNNLLQIGQNNELINAQLNKFGSLISYNGDIIQVTDVTSIENCPNSVFFDGQETNFCVNSETSDEYHCSTDNTQTCTLGKFLSITSAANSLQTFYIKYELPYPFKTNDQYEVKFKSLFGCSANMNCRNDSQIIVKINDTTEIARVNYRKGDYKWTLTTLTVEKLSSLTISFELSTGYIYFDDLIIQPKLTYSCEFDNSKNFDSTCGTMGISIEQSNELTNVFISNLGSLKVQQGEPQLVTDITSIYGPTRTYRKCKFPYQNYNFCFNDDLICSIEFDQNSFDSCTLGNFLAIEAELFDVITIGFMDDLKVDSDSSCFLSIWTIFSCSGCNTTRFNSLTILSQEEVIYSVTNREKDIKWSKEELSFNPSKNNLGLKITMTINGGYIYIDQLELRCYTNKVTETSTQVVPREGEFKWERYVIIGLTTGVFLLALGIFIYIKRRNSIISSKNVLNVQNKNFSIELKI